MTYDTWDGSWGTSWGTSWTRALVAIARQRERFISVSKIRTGL